MSGRLRRRPYTEHRSPREARCPVPECACVIAAVQSFANSVVHGTAGVNYGRLRQRAVVETGTAECGHDSAILPKVRIHCGGRGQGPASQCGLQSAGSMGRLPAAGVRRPVVSTSGVVPWNKKVPNPPGHPFNGLKNFTGEFDWGVLPKPENAYGDMKAVEYGQRFLQQKHDKPFLLCVGLWHPHIPMFSPKEYWDMYPDKDVRIPIVPEDDLEDIPPVGKELAAVRRDEHERIVKEGKWKEAVHAYLAAISFADHMIGMMLDALDNSEYAKNTVIVFYSDNGWHLGEKVHWHKSTLWQRASHVPFIMAGPGTKAAGVPRDQPVTLLDIYPTLVQMSGLPKNQTNEGTSLVPLLTDPKTKGKPAVITYLKGNHAVITERWRYIRYHDGTEELYDEKADPHEFHNIAGQEKYAALKKELAAYMPKTNAEPVPERSAYDFDFATYTWKRKS